MAFQAGFGGPEHDGPVRFVLYRARPVVAISAKVLRQQKRPQDDADRDRVGVYQMGVEVSAYTVMVPLIIAALERLCLNAVVTSTLRSQILEALLAKWKKAISWEEIWGPGNTTALAGALENIGCSPMVDIDSKLRILDSLSNTLADPLVLQAFSRICLSVPDSTPVDEIADEAAKEMLKTIRSLNDIKKEELPIVLPALGNLAARPTSRLRRPIVDLLFDGLKQDVPNVPQCLSAIADLPTIPKTLRTEITTRLRTKGVRS